MTEEKIGEDVIGTPPSQPSSQPSAWGRGGGGSRWERNADLRKKITALLIKTGRPMTVQEISDTVECSWVTAKAILNDLAVEGKLKFYLYRDGYGRLYQINEDWLSTKAAEKEV